MNEDIEVDDTAQFIEGASADVCFGSDESSLEATVDRYFTADYRQRTDGRVLDRREFVEHLRALRTKIVRGHVEVLEAVRQGHRIADRHLVTVTKRDGTVSQIEVYLFGQLASDGRLRRVDEVSRVVSGTAEDAELARAR